MTQTPTTRLGLIAPSLTDPADVPTYLEDILVQLDILTPGGKGTLAGRPTSSVGSPGIPWRIYIVTDQPTGAPSPRVDVDTGTGWFTVGPSVIADGSITTAKIQASAITQALLANLSVGTPQLILGAVTNAILAAAAVDATKVANSLKPSAGASAATEALRALGTDSGQALPGNDASVTNTRTPTDGSVTAAKLATVLPVILVNGIAHQCQMVTFEDLAHLAGGANASYLSSGRPTFTNACVSVQSETFWYSDSGFTTPALNGGGWISFKPNGTSVIGTYDTGSDLYAHSFVTAIGY